MLKCCIHQDNLKLVGYWFVDNSTTIYIDPYLMAPTKETMNLNQALIDIFSVASQARGGQISVKKNKYYLLEFKWDTARKWRLSENKSDLFLNTPEGPPKIERIPPSQASIIIGAWITPNDSYTEQTKRLREITSSWEDRVQSIHIRNSDV